MPGPIRPIDPDSAVRLLDDLARVWAGLAFYANDGSAPDLAQRQILAMSDAQIEALYSALYRACEAEKQLFTGLVDITQTIDAKRTSLLSFFELHTIQAVSTMHGAG